MKRLFTPELLHNIPRDFDGVFVARTEASRGWSAAQMGHLAEAAMEAVSLALSAVFHVQDRLPRGPLILIA